MVKSNKLYSDPWRNNSFQAFVQLADNAGMQKVSAKIKDAKMENVTPADVAFKPMIQNHRIIIA